MQVKALVCVESEAPLQVLPVTLPELGPEDVEVKVLYCGVCSTDLSACGKYKMSRVLFPLVAGHEGVGEVVAAGALATSVKVGDKVGLGYFRNSCKSCELCLKGWDNCCEKSECIFRDGNHGAFGSMVRINHHYAVPLPESIPLHLAGPLMCAGSTVFAPFLRHNIPPTAKVGIVGIGGLGHLAVQFASKWGCEVTAFSRTDSKEAEVRSLGAHNFVVTGDKDSVARAADSVDVILMTAAGAGVDWAMLFSFLKKRGHIYCLGITGADITLSALPLIVQEKGISGLIVGSRYETRQMLEFAAKHDVRPLVEVFRADEVNEVFERLERGEVRYRAVLEFGSLRHPHERCDNQSSC